MGHTSSIDMKPAATHFFRVQVGNARYANRPIVEIQNPSHGQTSGIVSLLQIYDNRECSNKRVSNKPAERV